MTPTHQSYLNGWQVRWSTLAYGTVEARNPLSKRRSARDWHKVSFGFLRETGIQTPSFKKESWEIDWNRRQGKRVWARNPLSKMPTARVWHWIDFHTVQNAGLPWQNGRVPTGRYKDGAGYILLTRRWLTEEDAAFADEFDLWRGKRHAFIREHHLVAVKKYRRSLKGFVVRHFNGIKDDNSPSNILIGTTAENIMDHNTARLMAIYWRNKYEELLAFK